MAGETNPLKNDNPPETSEKVKKQWQLNTLILAGVFLLSVVLPPEYKAFAPLLFVIPFIINVANKIRQADKAPENPSLDHTYTTPASDRISAHEPYTYKPKNPKDPRKYKPIG